MRMHLELDIKVPNAVLSPVLAPGVLNQPAVESLSDVPANNLDCMAGAVLLVAGQHLVDTRLVDQEVPVDGDDCNDGAVVDDLLLDVLLLLGHTVVGHLELLAPLGGVLALLGALGL